MQRQFRVGGLFNPVAPPRFSTLLRSSAEVADLAAARSWDAKVLTGDNATEGSLKRLPLSNYDILQYRQQTAGVPLPEFWITAHPDVMSFLRESALSEQHCD
jgi:hypothetical protein